MSGENYQSGGMCRPAPRSTGWALPITVLRGGLPIGGTGDGRETEKDGVQEDEMSLEIGENEGEEEDYPNIKGGEVPLDGCTPSILNSSLLSDKPDKDGSMDLREEGWLLNTTPLQGHGGGHHQDLVSSILLSSKLELSLTLAQIPKRKLMQECDWTGSLDLLSPTYIQGFKVSLEFQHLAVK